jgi:hypothetical protein
VVPEGRRFSPEYRLSVKIVRAAMRALNCR